MQSTLSPLNCPGVNFCGCQGVKRQLTTKMFLSNGSVSSAGLVNRSFLRLLDVDCFCIALFSTLEQTHCALDVRAEKHTLPKKRSILIRCELLWTP